MSLVEHPIKPRKYLSLPTTGGKFVREEQGMRWDQLGIGAASSAQNQQWQ